MLIDMQMLQGYWGVEWPSRVSEKVSPMRPARTGCVGKTEGRNLQEAIAVCSKLAKKVDSWEWVGHMH